jgi:hypothetical protein
MYATQFSSVRITWLEYEFREVRADSPQYVIVNLDTSSWTGVKETSLFIAAFLNINAMESRVYHYRRY